MQVIIDWRNEVEDIDGQLRALLERRSQLLGRAAAAADADAARPHARHPPPQHHTHLPHPDAHLAHGDLP